MLSLTFEPTFSRLPGRGLCRTTTFLAMLEATRATAPTRQCERPIATRALARRFPTTLGTTHRVAGAPKPRTLTGRNRLTVVPSPSSPSPFTPQHLTPPVARTP